LHNFNKNKESLPIPAGTTAHQGHQQDHSTQEINQFINITYINLMASLPLNLFLFLFVFLLR